MQQLTAKYTNRYTSRSSRVSVVYAPAAAPTRLLRCPGFAFGSESHPADFRCQNCGHFAWSGHTPAAAWASGSNAPERLALGAMEVILAEGGASEAMLETMRAWVRELRRADLATGDEAIVNLFADSAGD